MQLVAVHWRASEQTHSSRLCTTRRSLTVFSRAAVTAARLAGIFDPDGIEVMSFSSQQLEVSPEHTVISGR